MPRSYPHIPPIVRLVFLIALGFVTFLAMNILMLQPASGWTWNLTHWRSPFAVSLQIWVCVGTGIIAYLISAWIWALKPFDPPAILFAASGLATLVFCFAAALDDVALTLPHSIISASWILNILGACSFGIIMPCLFAIYPSPLPGWRWICSLIVLIFGNWTTLRIVGPFQNFGQVHIITFVEMLTIIGVVVWQVLVSRADPRRYAIAIWLGVSTILGAGGFIGSVAAPLTFDYPALLPPKFAFTFFLIIYFGLAIGLVRYRLFDLGAWAYQLVFYVVGALFLFVVDVMLVSLLALDRAQAIGISLFLVALLYLPIRDVIWRKIVRTRDRRDENLLQNVLSASLKPNAQLRSRAWKRLLQIYFAPLEIHETAKNGPDAQLESEGLALYVPAIAENSALMLQYPGQGRALFSPRDAKRADQLVEMMRFARENRDAYDRGVSEERTRIAQDIHDNIGAQLMRALHSREADRKNVMIRDTLADLRDVINNAQSELLSIDEVLADLRVETADRLEPHNIALDWQVASAGDEALQPAMVHALRSFIREAASNTIKHSGASRFEIALNVENGELQIMMRDNGKGFVMEEVQLGHGIENMRSRMEGLGGRFELKSGPDGSCLQAQFPLDGGGA